MLKEVSLHRVAVNVSEVQGERVAPSYEIRELLRSDARLAELSRETKRAVESMRSTGCGGLWRRAVQVLAAAICSRSRQAPDLKVFLQCRRREHLDLAFALSRTPHAPGSTLESKLWPMPLGSATRVPTCVR